MDALRFFWAIFQGRFPRWTALSLQRDWDGTSRCWPNLHVRLYLHKPSDSWLRSHPRSLQLCRSHGCVGRAISHLAQIATPRPCGRPKTRSSGIGTEHMPSLRTIGGRSLLLRLDSHMKILLSLVWASRWVIALCPEPLTVSRLFPKVCRCSLKVTIALSSVLLGFVELEFSPVQQPEGLCHLLAHHLLTRKMMLHRLF